MFFDIGPLELITLVLLAVIIFGPDKLPKIIKDVTGMIRKLRDFSDSAKEDIRRELGPDFKDFEFEDLNPRTFVRKNLIDHDRLGLKELRGGFDLGEELTTVSDAVQEGGSAVRRAAGWQSPADGFTAGPDLLRKRGANGSAGLAGGAAGPGPVPPGEPPPFDADAT